MAKNTLLPEIEMHLQRNINWDWPLLRHTFPYQHILYKYIYKKYPANYSQVSSQDVFPRLQLTFCTLNHLFCQ